MTTKFHTHTVLSKPSSNGKCSVIIRVSAKGDRTDLYTGITVLPSQWNHKKERVKQGSRVEGYEYYILNEQLNEQEGFVVDYFNNSVAHNVLASVKDLKKRFNYKYKAKPEERANEFFYLFDAYMDEKKDDWNQDMKDVVKRLRDRIQRLNPKISFASLNTETMDEIKKDLSSTMYNDALEKNLSYLKSFIVWARNKNYTINDEYFAYKPKLPKAKKAVRYLEVCELEAICNLDLSNDPALDRTRDFFVFQCYTALRYSDLAQLKRHNFTYDEERGCYYIDLVTEKDDDRVNYRLAKRAEAIYLKYSEYLYEDDKAFPVLSNQKYNEHLKDLGKLAELKGEWIDIEYRLLEKIEVKTPKTSLTTHTARRTFVVTAMNEGAPLDLIATITSHSDFNAMKPYIKANKRGTDTVIDYVDKAESGWNKRV